MGTPNTGKELCPWALEGPWAAGPRCTSHPSEGGLCSGAPPAPPRSGHSGPPCSQQQRLPSPRPSSCVGLCGGLEGASAPPQDRSFGLGRAGAGWGGQAPLLGPGLLPPLQLGPGEHRGLGASRLSPAGLCPRVASSRLCLGEPSPETKARGSAWCLALQTGTTVARDPSPMGVEHLPGAPGQPAREARPRKQGSTELSRR